MWLHCTSLDLDDDDDDDDEEEEEDEEEVTAEKGPSFSVYSHTPEDLYLDPSGQMVFETNETSGKEPGQGLGQGHAKEKVLFYALTSVQIYFSLLSYPFFLLLRTSSQTSTAHTLSHPITLHTPYHILSHTVLPCHPIALLSVRH